MMISISLVNVGKSQDFVSEDPGRETHLDSNATSSMISFKLSNIDEYLSEVDDNILKFNGYVTHSYRKLIQH